MRIKDQFAHTVVRGDKLKDVLEHSGLDEEISRQMIASYPELKNLKRDNRYIGYWIMMEIWNVNWLVSEREERIYEELMKLSLNVKF